MKKTIDTQKGLEIVDNIVDKAFDVGKKTVDSAQKNARILADKTKDELQRRKVKKYGPVFREIFDGGNTRLPSIIMIVDDIVRRDIDVCEGAVGWIKVENGVEILYLYDEAVQMSGINFIPMAFNDTVYYIYHFDKSRYIKTDYIFGKATEERMAELQYIAYSLGAKSCTIEISDSSIEKETHHKESKGKIAADVNPHANLNLSVDSEQDASSNRKESRKGRVFADFVGNDNPIRPELKWFKDDNIIKSLIDMRLENGNSIKSQSFELSGASSATMSHKSATAIDGVIKAAKIKGSNKFSNTVSEQVTKECNSTLIYSIEF
jgi:hypothetical protein